MLQKKNDRGWKFIGDDGAFALQNPQRTSYLYFPLANETGMMSVITPLMHGDIKSGQNTFLMAPVSAEDLHTSRAARNFWVWIEGYGVWSATGNSPAQIAQAFADDSEEEVTLEAGFLWHKLTRVNRRLGLRAEITSFVPADHDSVELMKISLTNVSGRTMKLTPTAALPLYGRSADNVRDHRHVTSLLHRIRTATYGVIVQPTLSFDERGHKPNRAAYGVFGAEGEGAPPVGFFPVVEDFIGEGGCLEWPESVVRNLPANCVAGRSFAGYEAVGALRFPEVTLKPAQTRSYVIALAILEEGEGADAIAPTYCSENRFETLSQRNAAYWQDKLSRLEFGTGDSDFNRWLKWVALQPILRRIYGCSFLPHHDYGRGGRGWRDLWQDCLALLIMDPTGVRSLLLNNYAGVRMDGSNATIIGTKPGEFIADRNNIPRIWMDHGAWPFLTTKLYIDQSGDLEFLLEKQTYFKDALASRAKDRDPQWETAQGTKLMNPFGEVYRGTILEHILVQHLTSFFNVGAHNNIRLEGADWNDGLDMASQQGESVAFTALYASNLRELVQLLRSLQQRTGRQEVELAQELEGLLDTLSGGVEYSSVDAKHARLDAYFSACHHTVSGQTVKVSIQTLAQDLERKANWLYDHIREEEWVRDEKAGGWFNGYYNNDGERVEGVFPSGVRMTLTGQVFPLMGGIATDEQTRNIAASAKRHLFDPRVGGYRLNTDFGGVQLNLGRCFGFAFGHKENGAMFSHMAVMFANALYRRGLVTEGYEVVNTLYAHCKDFETSRIYPGIPEYINERGRGMYHYLTGSASWLLLTMLTEVLGVKGELGDLRLEPKLLERQFDSRDEACVRTMFGGRRLAVVYRNPARRDYGRYQIATVLIDGQSVEYKKLGRAVCIPRGVIAALDETRAHRLDVELAAV
jgi:cellobiose phosphorylase